MRVTCPANASAGCRGTITIWRAKSATRRARVARCARGCRALGRVEYEARAGQTKRIRVHMASFGRHRLARRKKLAVTVVATRVSGGDTATTSLAITLRAHRRTA
jgi:hypothetical protein